MSSVTVSAAAPLINAISNYGSVKEYSTTLEECLQAVKRHHQCMTPLKWETDDEVETKKSKYSLADFMHLVQKVIKI